MNTALLRSILSLAGACLLLMPRAGFAQITLINAQATNVSGMCYITLDFSQASQACCMAVYSDPVVPNGQTLSTILTYSYIADCQSFPECKAPVISTTLVLGQLDPGDYFLLMTNRAFSPFVRNISFPISAPADNTPMLSLTATNGGLYALNVNGVPFVRYVVQASTDYTNWTDIHTNIGAPFSMIISPTNNATFYRTQLYSSY